MVAFPPYLAQAWKEAGTSQRWRGQHVDGAAHLGAVLGELGAHAAHAMMGHAALGDGRGSTLLRLAYPVVDANDPGAQGPRTVSDCASTEVFLDNRTLRSSRRLFWPKNRGGEMMHICGPVFCGQRLRFR